MKKRLGTPRATPHFSTRGCGRAFAAGGVLCAATLTGAGSAAGADVPPTPPWRATAASHAAFPAAGELLREAVSVRVGPAPGSPSIRVLRDFRPDFRRQVVLAFERRTGADGKPWLRISVPMRPNGRTGWIPAGAARVAPVRTHVVVRRDSRWIEIWRTGRRLVRARVAVGAPGAETPLGAFYVTARFWPTDSFYGPFALETSAYSRLSDWPGGGVVGIHGTSLPQLLGRAVSHGCVRVRNDTALRLRDLVPVGSPIHIVR